MSVPTHPVPSTSAASSSVGAVVRPVIGLGAAVRWLILLTAALAGVAVSSEVYGIVSMDRLMNGWPVAGELESYLVVSGVVTLTLSVAMLTSGICWFVWQYRAAVAVEAAGRAARRRPAWHVISWMIPVVAWWFPFQNVSDIVRASGAAVSSRLRAGWWTLWIAASVMSGVGNRLTSTAETVPALMGAATASLLADALTLATVPFAWIIVDRTSRAVDVLAGVPALDGVVPPRAH